VVDEDLNGCWWRATGAYFEAAPREKCVLGRLGVQNDLQWTMMVTFGGLHWVDGASVAVGSRLGGLLCFVILRMYSV
jgi:hypothetical protein